MDAKETANLMEFSEKLYTFLLNEMSERNLSLAVVVGTLELIKQSIIQEVMEQEEDKMIMELEGDNEEPPKVLN